MQNAPQVTCPTCGRTDPKAIAKQYDYPLGMGPWNSKPTGISYAYMCQCGAGFTHMISVDEYQALLKRIENSEA